MTRNKRKLTPQENKQISKYLSLILRHRPEKGGLILDEQGFAALTDVLNALRCKRIWQDMTEDTLREVVATNDKQRYEIVEDQIRARYGHSVPQQVTYPKVEPPEVLYHGTAPGVVSVISQEGLLPMGRQYVHLSSEPEQANAVGRRHCPNPVLLTVRAREAWWHGVAFYCPEARLYLADAVPPQFLDFPE